ncbi:carbohydrate ABC transporter permease [Anaerocolumna jejuensis]|uniref:carbohydrate ABC transporter permease n=1 Tax=Anaerocolumna jejuensis TaxID=259063 RepID=UPI003F7B595C
MKNEKAKDLSPGLRKRKFKAEWEGYLYILPWLIGFFILTAWPMIYSLYLSFTNYSLFKAPEFVGLKNYTRMLTKDLAFQKALVTTLKFVILAVPLKLIFALFVATKMNKTVKGMSLYRTLIYIPSLLGGSVAVAVIWKNIFGVDGYINIILSSLGFEKIGWLTNTKMALPTIVLLNLWQFGSSMIIFLAGLKAIPNTLYEASGIDGAGKIRSFFTITLPMLSPVLFFNLVYGVIGAFQQFNSAFLITKGGPANSTYLYALMLYEKAFKSYEMGYAAGMAWILLVIIGGCTGIMFLLSKFWVFYDN